MTDSRAASALADAKDDARTLERFFAKVGITLKHTHALEAVAHLRQHSNYHLLSHASSQSSSSDDVWIVNAYAAGMLPEQRIAFNRSDAILCFARIIGVARVSISRTEIDVRVGRSPAVGLFAFTDGTLVASMTAATIQEPSKSEPLFPGSVSLDDVAATLTSLVWEDGNDWDELREIVDDNDLAAVHGRELEHEATRGARSRPSDHPDLPLEEYERVMSAVLQAAHAECPL